MFSKVMTVLPQNQPLSRCSIIRAASAILIAIVGALGTALAGDGAFPMRFQDSKGHWVELASLPQRIVSLNPGNTEILAAMGRVDRIRGVDEFSRRAIANYLGADAAEDIRDVGKLLTPSFETIVALRPDLVLITEMSETHRTHLEQLGLRVALIDPYLLSEVYDAARLLGRIVDDPEAAAELVADLQARVKAVQDRVADSESHPGVFVEVWSEPLRTAGPGTFLDELIGLAGGTNIAADADSAWPLFSQESVVARNPDVILTPLPDTVERLLSGQRSQWAGVRAVRNRRVYWIDQDTFSRPGPRLIDTLEKIAELLHPTSGQ